MINDGKLKFKKSDGPAKVKNSSMTKVEMLRQGKGAPNEASLGKAAIPKEKVSIAKVQRSEIGSSSTTEGSKEQSREPNGKEEK